MRNLKKVLSLALALVMLVGMMTIGAGAATYIDSDQVTKTAAVDVMSGIGVLTGTDTGAFNPQGNLNREQAAKILACMTVGPNVASILTASSAPFPDVPANSWSAGYIAYCSSAAGGWIITGMDDGRFHPWDTLTVTQFAKMLLVAIGNDPYRYVGDAWVINTQADSLKTTPKLTENVGITDWNAAITREQASQMAFNALNVSPNGATEVYDVMDNANTAADATDDTVVKKGITDIVTAYILSSTNTQYYVVPRTINPGSLAETVFGLEQRGGTDDFGRPTDKWTVNNGKTTVSEQPSGTATKVYKTAAEPSKDFANYTPSASAKVVTNGVEGAAVTVAGLDALTGNGKIVEVYTTGTTINKVVVINKSVVKLTTDPVVSNGKVTISDLGIVAADVAKVTGYNTVAKGDVVLYVNNGAGVFMVEKATKITAPVTGYTAGTIASTAGTVGAAQALINGNYYKQSILSGRNYTAKITDTKLYNIYLDDGNCICWTEDAETGATQTAQLGVITQLAWVKPVSDNSIGSSSTAYVQARMVFMDGTEKIVRIGTIDGVGFIAKDTNLTGLGTHYVTKTSLDDAAALVGQNITSGTATMSDANDRTKDVKAAAQTYYSVADGAAAKSKGVYYCVETAADLDVATKGAFTLKQFYKWTEKNGVYTLTSVTNQPLDTTATIVSNNPVFQTGTAASGIANASTLFIYASGTVGRQTYQVYTGIANVPGTAGSVTGNSIKASNGIATHVFVDLGDGETANTSTDKVFITNTDFVTVNGDPAYKQGTALVNGTEATVKLAAADNSGTEINYTPGKLYSVTNVDSNGIYTLDSGATPTVGIKSIKDGVLMTRKADNSADDVFAYGATALAYVLDGKTVTTTTIAALALDANDKVTVVSAGGVATAVYVQKVSQAPTAVTLEASDTTASSVAVTGTTANLLTGAGEATGWTSAKNLAKLSITVRATGGGTAVKSVSVNGSLVVDGNGDAITSWASGNDITLRKGSNTITVIIKDNYGGPDSILTYTVTAAE